MNSDVVDHVVRYKVNHCHLWRDRDDNYWLQRLMQEAGELASVLAGDHDDTVEHELTQIASIAIAWLELRDERAYESEQTPAPPSNADR